MDSSNTSGIIMESTSPKMSRTNQIKNSPNGRSSPQPLKFRSFDAFYQYYSKKNTYEVSQHRTPLTQNQNSKTKSSNSNNKPTDNNNKLDNKCGVSPEPSKPKFTYTTEDYNIKGRVKRLCEIFQKARDDNHYRAKLEKVISNNKLNTKNNASNTSKHETQPQNEPENCQYQSQIYIKRDQNTRTNTDLLPLKFYHGSDSSCLDREEVIFNTPLMFQSPSGELVDEYDYRPGYPSPKAASPLKSSRYVSEKRAPTIDEITSILSAQKISQTNPQNEFPGYNRLDKNAIIDDILNNFMNDPEFCDTFFSKLETLNLYNNANTLEFSKLIDELQFLVENDNNIDNLTKLDSVDHKDFEWFFNQPKVFDFNAQDQTNAVDLKPHLFENETNITSSTSTEFNLLLEQSSSDSLESISNTCQPYDSIDSNNGEQIPVEDPKAVEDSNSVDELGTVELNVVEGPKTVEDSNTEQPNAVEEAKTEKLNAANDPNEVMDPNAVVDSSTEDPDTQEPNAVDSSTEECKNTENNQVEESESVPEVGSEFREENQPDFSDFDKFNLDTAFNTHLSKHFDWINTNN
ncbi:uncharacterized protein TA12520 [Theileria annulata]|uniref:Uncharacterized protein n=1 Tax=Theileria annulata TaxID=5874 RepID=Q4UE23_THEAN|nr:uncharacterized protein TA12520 [Theileria annulata]CAI74666.1 hypothetical protein TA12520 [Theileria annulata]|eukprot:XP_952398.1 hypothetical protein TA12520 [Theileria annulata]